jgi:hypothetical protein
MPLLSTRGAASARGFGLFGGIVAPQSFWIAELTGSGTSNNAIYGIATNSLGDAYTTGVLSGGGAQLSGIQKINTDGVLQWQISYGNGSSGVGTQGWAMAVDSSGNMFFAGKIQSNDDLALVKYDSSGTLQWQRQLGANSENETAYGVATDSSGDIYIVGESSTSAYGIVAKYNTSGTIQWQYKIGGSGWGGNVSFRAITVDSSGYIYVVGSGGTSATAGSPIQVVKLDSSGTTQWVRRFSDANAAESFAVSTDSSNNVYVGGRYDNGASATDIFVMKLNSSGTRQWSVTLNGAAGTRSDEAYGIGVDSSANVFIAGFAGGGAPNYYNALEVLKYDTSGTLQWQREITLPTDSVEGYAISVSSKGVPYVTGRSSFPFYAKLPSDGSKTGAYTVNGRTYTYAASSMTSTSKSMNESSSTVVLNSSSLTASTPSITSPTTSLTFTKTAVV